MKSFKNIALLAVAAMITLGAVAQTDSSKTGSAKTKQPAMKEKTKTTEHPNGASRTVTKSKPTNKTVKADSTTTR